MTEWEYFQVEVTYSERKKKVVIVSTCALLSINSAKQSKPLRLLWAIAVDDTCMDTYMLRLLYFTTSAALATPLSNRRGFR